MPKVRMPDGSLVDVGTDALFADDGTTPFGNPNPQATPPGQTFTAEDIARARSEEKDKLYSRIESLTSELTGFKEQVGSLTAAEQRRQAQAAEEKARLEEEARKAEEADLDAKTLLQRREQDWNSQLTSLNQTWEQKFEEERKQREAAEAVAAREREFNDLRGYIQAQVEANAEKIAPQLIPWVGGNSKEEVDAAVARAVQTTDEIAASLQEALPNQQQQQIVVPGQQQVAPQPPAMPGTRVTTGPQSDPNQQFQQLTAEQIQQMPMSEYAKLRDRLGVSSGSSNNRGLYG